MVKHLLVADLTKRYGNLKGGVEDIKKHRWFKTIDWQLLYDKKIVPLYKPEIKYYIYISYDIQIIHISYVYIEEEVTVAVSELIQTQLNFLKQ